jgi:hypothetical protein
MGRGEAASREEQLPLLGRPDDLGSYPPRDTITICEKAHDLSQQHRSQRIVLRSPAAKTLAGDVITRPCFAACDLPQPVPAGDHGAAF